MAKLKAVVFPILPGAEESYTVSVDIFRKHIRTIAGFPSDALFVRQTEPWNQDVLVYWYYHASFEDIPDYNVYHMIFLKREQINNVMPQ